MGRIAARGQALSQQDARELWRAVFNGVRARYPELYRTWFEDLPPGDVLHGELVISLDDPVRTSYLRHECREALIESAMTITGHMMPVRIVCTADDQAVATSSVPALTRTPLGADYTFEQFVVGASNRMAHAAARAVCAQPGAVYNPLFIHGPSGLGKTHLLQATCAELTRVLSGADILYVTCEAFINDFVRAIRDGRVPHFQATVRAAGAIVIDDVQFLAERETSQEEFFHTFNTLYQSGRQIILSADKAPDDIPTLEDRLISRFSWGLVTKIDPPDRETRCAILAKKAELRGLQLAPEILYYVAERVDSNVRSLEGALKSLMLESQASNRPVSLELARDVLGNRGTPARPVQVVDIIDAVSTHFGVRAVDLVGRKRSRSISYPRQVGMYLARRLTAMSLEEIGVHFGGRDHTTVLHAERSIAQECLTSNHTADAVSALTTVLTSRRDS